MKYSLIKRFSFALIAFILFMYVPSTSYSQWIVGVKGGYISTKITGADVYGGMNYKGGIEAGVVLSKKLKVDFAFESGIFLSQTGVNQKFIEIIRVQENNPTLGMISTDSTFRYDNELSLTYLKVPLMLRKSFSIKGSNLYPYRRKISITDIDVMVGPYVAYRIGASEKLSTKVSIVTKDKDGKTTASVPESELYDPYHLTFKIGRDTINQVVWTDPTMDPGGNYINPYLPARAGIKEGISKLDVGIAAALGLSIELSPDSKLMFGANYSMGLMTIDKEYFSNLQYTISPGGPYEVGLGTPVSITKEVKTKMDLKNTGFGFYVGYVFYMQ